MLVVCPGCRHFTGKLILIKLVGADGFYFCPPGLWIWDHIDGNRGTEEEQSVPGCCTARTWPPGGYDGHAIERCGARCPGCWQGNITINTTAHTINIKAPGVQCDQSPAKVLESNIIAAWIADEKEGAEV